MATASGATAAGAAPVGLTGEAFKAIGDSGEQNVGEITVTDCEDEGPGPTTIHFEASGIATGPYPGTFTEQGTITIGERDSFNFTTLGYGFGLSDGPVTVFEANFEIISGDTIIRGTKTLGMKSPYDGQYNNNGVCGSFENIFDANRYYSGSYLDVGAWSTYQATIKTPTGTYRDSGTAITYIRDFDLVTPIGETAPIQFIEYFVLSDGVTPVAPTTSEQCMNGGHRLYLGFKNQGDCVAFVETGGKNEPGQNLPGLP